LLTLEQANRFRLICCFSFRLICFARTWAGKQHTFSADNRVVSSGGYLGNSLKLSWGVSTQTPPWPSNLIQCSLKPKLAL
jgi:hypothetical protein